MKKFVALVVLMLTVGFIFGEDLNEATAEKEDNTTFEFVFDASKVQFTPYLRPIFDYPYMWLPLQPEFDYKLFQRHMFDFTIKDFNNNGIKFGLIEPVRPPFYLDFNNYQQLRWPGATGGIGWTFAIPIETND
jgi:hypothetical protein